MDILARIRQKCFFAIMLVGGLAGLCESHWDEQGLLFNFFCGIIVVIMGGFLGSFIGFFVKNSLRYFRGIRKYAGEMSDGIFLGSLFGAVVGILGQIFIGTEPHTALGAMIGSAVGGFLGALPDETILAYVLTAMYSDNDDDIVDIVEIVDIVDIVDTCPNEHL